MIPGSYSGPVPKLIIGQAGEIPQPEYVGVLRLQPLDRFGQTLPVLSFVPAGDGGGGVIQAGMRAAAAQEIDAAVPKHDKPPGSERPARIVMRKAL